MKKHLLTGVAAIALGAMALPAFADDAAPASTALSQPPLAGPLAANPNPVKFKAGPLGDIYVSGVLTGFGQLQTNAVQGDRRSQADFSNGQVIVQKTDGIAQFYVQAGAYSMPSLGTSYVRASKASDNYYGVVPVAYAKLAPSDEFSVQAGKLPTLIGAEYTFTFQNFNIERGLLWNQEPAVSQGAQVNYTVGPLALSASVTDGFYSNRYNWLTGLATYTFDPINSLTFVGGANVDQSRTSTTATPLLQNNSQVYNLIYTYSNDPWTVVPYLQYTYVPKNTAVGIGHSASTFGGAVLAKYSFAAGTKLEGVSLPVRFEYIGASGNLKDGTPNLLYGAGSAAWSVTVTPTYQKDIFFTRAELSFVGTQDTAAGAVFGKRGTDKNQTRGVIEVGVLF